MRDERFDGAHREPSLGVWVEDPELSHGVLSQERRERLDGEREHGVQLERDGDLAELAPDLRVLRTELPALDAVLRFACTDMLDDDATAACLELTRPS